ncbi:MAG: gamma-glutamylcyclotransferase [Candidimonas sp.]
MRRSLNHWTPDQDVWVYGYGSLIWRPEFEFAEQRLARLHGYHRALCLWSRVNRGTPEKPGLVFGLDAGGSCMGKVYRIAARHVPDTMEALWRREMPSGAYIPRWLSCKTETGNVSALAFTMDRRTDAYVHGLDILRQIDIVLGATGKYGPCVEYVLETEQALRRNGIKDQRLSQLALALRAAMGGNV